MARAPVQSRQVNPCFSTIEISSYASAAEILRVGNKSPNLLPRWYPTSNPLLRRFFLISDIL